MRTRTLALLALLVAAPAAAQSGPLQVAVLDTGVDADHPELAGRVERMSFAPPPASLPAPLDLGLLQEDPDGQGTGVASVVAGASLGVAPDARILDLQVAAPYTGTALDPPDEAAAVQAMDWLLRNPGGPPGGPRVALLSFAAQGVSDEGAATLAAQAQSLWEAGLAVIVPASDPLTTIQLSRHVLTVGPAESCGPGADLAGAPPKPDLVAPSVDVAVATPGTGPLAGATGIASGAPYAAATVAGAAARMWQARPDLPVQALYDLLRATAAGTAEPGFDPCTGFGAVDVERAEAAALGWTDPLAESPGRESPAPPLAPALLALALLTAVRRRA